MLSKGARLFVLNLLIAAASVAAVGPAQAEVSQTPGATACPAGYPLMSVAAFRPPYYVPALVDTGGNMNGWVCAKPQPDSARDNDCKHGGEVACELEALGLPHYLFKDDDSPALKGTA
jgi:hypothetical protein